MAPDLPVSPYIIGPPISDPSDFYGRYHQISQFFNVLRRTLQSLRVLGLRRSGKTSFLLHIAQPEVAGPELQNDSRLTIIAYVDPQAGIETPSGFYLAVAEAIACSTPLSARPQVIETYPDFRSFSKWLESILAPSEGLRLVVLLDEFEVLARSPEFGSSFFGSLRSLVSRFPSRFAWVTASYSDLYTLLPRDLTSTFANIFHPTPIILGALEPGEIERLICDPAESSGVEFSPQEVQAIQDIAGAMPYFLCIVADQWFLARKPDVPVAQCREKVLALLLDPYGPISEQLDQYWWHLTNQEQDCLCQVALGESRPRTSGYVEKKLVDFGLLDRYEGGLKIAGEVFGRWIENNHLQKRRPVDPNSVIVEATGFVFNEAREWIESIRKKAPDKTPPLETTLALPITEAQFLRVQTDLPTMGLMIDGLVAEMMVDKIEGLVEQIRIHHKNLIRLETKKAKYGIDVPVNVEQQIDHESRSIVEKTVQLVKLLNEVYRG